jgi:hypothetical protein
VAFLVGCDQAALMKSFTPTADESIARNCVDLLRQEKFDQIERQLDPTLVDSNLRNTLAEMAALFPHGDPESVKVVGLNVSQRQEYSATTIQLEYEFPGKWLLVSVTTQKKRRCFYDRRLSRKHDPGFFGGSLQVQTRREECR